MKNLKVPSLFKVSLFALVFVSATGCGKISNVVELNFPEVSKPPASPASSPFVGLVAAGGTKTSGQFKLEGSIGNQIPNAVKTSGSFKFYGGISREIFSR